MAANTNYQDLNALLQTLSAYAVPPVTAVQQGQQQPPEDQYYAGQASQAAHLNADGTSSYDPATFYNQSQAQLSYAYPQSQRPILDYYGAETTPHPQAYTHLGHNLSQPTAQAPPPSSSAQRKPTQPEAAQPYDPCAPLTSAPIPSTTPPLSPRPQIRPQLPPQPQQPITNWRHALRHVTSLATSTPTFASAIRAMITNQRTNELAWATSRHALLDKQAARVAGKRKLDDVLRSVGALQAVSVEGEGEKPEMGMMDEQELAVFDRKVHRAAVQMERAMMGELGALGVPFFGGDWEEEKEGKKGRPGKEELRVLRLRMIQHLEDMYKD